MFMKPNKLARVFLSNSVAELAMAFLPLGSLCWVLSPWPSLHQLIEMWNHCFTYINTGVTGKSWIGGGGGSSEELWQDVQNASEPEVLYGTFRTWITVLVIISSPSSLSFLYLIYCRQETYRASFISLQ